MLCSVCSGAYDNSNQTMIIAGYGHGDFNGTNWTGQRITIDVANPIVKDMTINRVVIQIQRAAAVAATNGCKIKVCSLVSGTTYRVDAEVDVSTEWNAIGGTGDKVLDVTGLSIPVTAGQFVGLYIDDTNLSNGKELVTDLNANSARSFNGADVTPTNTFTGTGVAASLNLIMEVYGEDNEYITTDDDTGFGDGDEINVHPWSVEPYYIVFEGVDVADNENLQIQFMKTNAADGVDTVVKSLQFNFIDLDGDEDYMTIDGFSTKTTSTDISGLEGNKFNVYCWIDPIADKMEIVYINVEDGAQQGGIGAADYQARSATYRAKVSVTANIALKRIKFVQDTGNTASVDRVVVCRKPILAIGDSFVSGNGPQALAVIGAALGAAFSETRYVINGGVGGGSMTTNVTIHSTQNRWNSRNRDNAASDFPKVLGDWVALRDVVVVIVNAGAANDVANANYGVNTSDTKKYEMAGRVIGAVGRIVGEALANEISSFQPYLGDSVDVILSEMIPMPDGDPQEQQAVGFINAGLRALSYSSNVPIALVFNSYDLDNYSDSPRIHPDATGSAFVADAIARAYENNTTFRLKTISGSGRRARYDFTKYIEVE